MKRTGEVISPLSWEKKRASIENLARVRFGELARLAGFERMRRKKTLRRKLYTRGFNPRL